MEDKRQITLVAEPESLPVFRDFIEKECERQGVTDEDIRYDLKVAVDEACTNIMTHGYAGMNPGPIRLSLHVKPENVSITITDFGKPFEPVEPKMHDKEAELEDWSIGGLGLFFIYQIMDQVRYERAEGSNRLIFVKRLPANASGETQAES